LILTCGKIGATKTPRIMSKKRTFIFRMMQLKTI
jgi:hypothetical protein